jgi:transposase
MFVRVKKSPHSEKKAVQIVESFRVGGKVRQRIVRHVGMAKDEEELKKLIELAEYIRARMESEERPGLFSAEEMARYAIEGRKEKGEKELKVDLRRLREKKRVVVGIHEAYGRIYKELGFDRVIGNPARRRAGVRNLFHIVMGRLSSGGSKMRTVKEMGEGFGVELSLASVYRMMDLLDEGVKKRIEERAYDAACGLLGGRIKVIFYDCTTIYFESFKEDEIRRNGYSKDMEFNETQVLVGVMVTERGLPVGYEVYEGSRYEGNTVRDAIEKIRGRYKVEEVIFVGDSGILNKKNIEMIEKLGGKYILGVRIKGMSKEVKEEIGKRESYKEVVSRDGERLWIKEIELGEGKRLIVSFSEARARKDAEDRQEAIQRLMKKIENGGLRPEDLVMNYGYKRFIKVEGECEVKIDEKKIEEDKKWDGLHGVITNHEGMKAEEVIAQYGGLRQVEETFRITKHDLKVRPIYHWTPRRIRAHIAICFMALCCARHLEYRLAVQKKAMSVERIRQALNSVQVSILEHIDTKALYGIPSLIREDAKIIYDTLGLKLSDVPYEIKRKESNKELSSPYARV